MTNKMRLAVVNKLIEQVRGSSASAHRSREQAIAVRMLRRRYGDDVFERCRALPEGWLHSIKQLHLHQSVYSQLAPCERQYVEYPRGESSLRPPYVVSLAEYAPLPMSASSGWDAGTVGLGLLSELIDWCSTRADLEIQIANLRTQTEAVLAAFTTVERLCSDWPEGYALLPAEMLAPVNAGVPAPRIEDLNARIAALRSAA